MCVCERVLNSSMSFKRLHLTQSTERDAYKTCPFMHTFVATAYVLIKKQTNDSNVSLIHTIEWKFRLNDQFTTRKPIPQHIFTFIHIYRRHRFQFWNRFCLHFFLMLLFSFVLDLLGCCMLSCVYIMRQLLLLLLLLLAACTAPQTAHLCS